jgi:hypothetical protein
MIVLHALVPLQRRFDPRLSCHRFVANAVRPPALRRRLQPGQLPAAAGPVEGDTGLIAAKHPAKLIKTGARMVRHARRIILQMAEVAVSRELFAALLKRLDRLRLTSG